MDNFISANRNSFDTANDQFFFSFTKAHFHILGSQSINQNIFPACLTSGCVRESQTWWKTALLSIQSGKTWAVRQREERSLQEISSMLLLIPTERPGRECQREAAEGGREGWDKQTHLLGRREGSPSRWERRPAQGRPGCLRAASNPVGKWEAFMGAGEAGREAFRMQSTRSQCRARENKPCFSKTCLWAAGRGAEFRAAYLFSLHCFWGLLQFFLSRGPPCPDLDFSVSKNPLNGSQLSPQTTFPSPLPCFCFGNTFQTYTLETLTLSWPPASPSICIL